MPYYFLGDSPMPTYSSGLEICEGDWVKVFVPEKGIWHDGIVRNLVETWEGFGVHIADNQKGIGSSLRDWNDFAGGQTVVIHRRAISEQHVQEILARVDVNLGKPYDLIRQNCQHFASYCFNGKAESTAVNFAWGLAAAAVVLSLLNGE